MTVSLITRTDVHLSAFAPQSRIDNYMESILDKLTQVGEIAAGLDADMVLDNGDLFHLKEPSRNPHRMLSRLAQVQNSYPCPTVVNAGNHDVKYGNMDYLGDQPLSVLYETGLFQSMATDHLIQKDGLAVRIVGIAYDPKLDMEKLINNPRLEKGDEDVLVICLHCFATPKGGELWGKEHAFSYSDLSMLDGDVFLLGHYHIDQGIKQVNDKWFINIGAIARGALTTDNLSRIPKVGHIFVNKRADGEAVVICREIELKVTPASEVFDLEKHDKAKKEAKDIQEFVTRLAAEAESVEGDNLQKHIKDLEFDEAVKESALGYLERAG